MTKKSTDINYISKSLFPKTYNRTMIDDDYIKQLEQKNKQLKNLIDIILNFSFFEKECPLNFEFENNTNEDKSQSVFYEDEWCENNCNDNYKDCWLKYFKKLQELEKSDNNE